MDITQRVAYWHNVQRHNTSVLFNSHARIHKHTHSKQTHTQTDTQTKHTHTLTQPFEQVRLHDYSRK